MSKIEDFKFGYDFFNRIIDMGLILIDMDIRDGEEALRLDERIYEEFTKLQSESDMYIININLTDFKNLGGISAILLRPIDYLKGILYLGLVHPLEHSR